MGAASAGRVRVLVDAVSARTGGGGSYVLAQMEALTRIEDLDLTIFATGRIADRLAAACPGATIRRRQAMSTLSRVLWEQLVLPVQARRFDVVYMPGNFALFLSPRPQILALQNAWYFTDPVRAFRRRHCSWRTRARLCVESIAARASVRRAHRVVVTSKSMLAAVQEDLGQLGHATVISSCRPRVAEHVAPPAPTEHLPPGYVLVVAHDDPHKEWDRLIELFVSRRGLPPLVIAGSPRRSDAWMAQLERRVGGRVRLLGRVDDAALLAGLYRHAGCCIAHSRFEAFGLTPLEALAHGTPVAASDIPAHREVCGARVAYYRLDDDDALVSAVQEQVRAKSAPSPPIRNWDDNAAELARCLRSEARERRSVGRHL